MKTKPIERAAVEAELRDYTTRRDQAQYNADNAQRAMNSAQAIFQNASREVIAYDAAAQACAKLLELPKGPTP